MLRIMVLSKYRCLLLWCFLLVIISIISINFLVCHNEHDDLVHSKFIRNSQDDQQKPIISTKKSDEHVFAHSVSATTTKSKIEAKSSKWKHYRLDQALEKPWFMINGTLRPSKNNHPSQLALWPEDIQNDDLPLPMNDRIVNQLMYIPEDYDRNDFVPIGKKPLKKILLAFGVRRWNDLILGRKRFQQDGCPVDACYLMADNRLIDKADAVLFKDSFVWPKQGRPSLQQLWILFLLESPYNTQSFSSLPAHLFNWTATYRHDSDLVAPYEKFVSYDSLWTPGSGPNNQPIKNYAKGKSKKVAWFVSNCGAKNQRLKYAKELSRYIEVDIYGSCGNHHCPRTKAKECFEMLSRDYKFYLAFENSNCRDYITEKFFVNGLGHNNDDFNVVPIVMGAHPLDYVRASPSNSYIHIDDFSSPAHLASYLHQLDQDDQAYNSYFQWKTIPRNGEFINTYFWCRLCAMLHANELRQKQKSYESIAEWWSPNGICLENSYHWLRKNQNDSFNNRL